MARYIQIPYLFFAIVLILFGTANSIKVELNERFTVEWSLEKQDTIVFEITVRQNEGPMGYVGFGISDNGGMRGADILAIILKPNGTVELKDMHGVGNTKPVLDKKQDYKLLGSSRNESHIKVKFSRPINNCDEKEDLAITDNTQYLIWSYGNMKEQSMEISYHANNRGAKAVNLLDPVFATVNTSAYKVWELHQDVVLNDKRTLYWCKFHKVEELGKKRHIVGFSVNLNDPLAKKHTHHASILACTPPEGQDADTVFSPFLNPEGYDCYYSETKIPRENCKVFEFQWAFGGTPTMFPEDVGVPFGEIGGAYYMTMLHLDNPSQTPGISFKTGYDLYYTDKIRKFDAGFFQIGINSTKAYSLTVPPNAKDYVLSSHCPAECTTGIPKDGINVFEYLLHFHLTGRKMKIRHFRNNAELPWLANDENYDTNYQNNRMLKHNVKILPGDHLTVECTYDSTERNGSAVIGGRGLFEEMCQAFLMYYPKIDVINRCGSAFSQEGMLALMNITKAVMPPGDIDPIVTDPDMWRGRRYTNVVEHGLPWTPKRMSAFQQETRYGYQDAECTGLPRGTKIRTMYPKVKTEYKPINKCNSHSSSTSLTSSTGYFYYIGCIAIALAKLY